MISPTSRYVNDPVTVVTDERGTHQSVNPAIPVGQSFAFTQYMVEEYDTIDWIAHEFLDDGALWWVLANANPEIMDWHDLQPGTVIRIPHV